MKSLTHAVQLAEGLMQTLRRAEKSVDNFTTSSHLWRAVDELSRIKVLVDREISQYQAQDKSDKDHVKQDNILIQNECVRAMRITTVEALSDTLSPVL